MTYCTSSHYQMTYKMPHGNSRDSFLDNLKDLPLLKAVLGLFQLEFSYIITNRNNNIWSILYLYK